jgi:glycosyltransferase involved in cell wall biosynthesis
VGGVADAMIDGETGYLVEKGNIETLQARLVQLLRDANLREDMGKRGRQFVVDNFDLEVMVNRHESFYLDAIRNHKAQLALEEST